MLEPMRLRRCGRLAVHSAKRNYDMVSQGNLRNRRALLASCDYAFQPVRYEWHSGLPLGPAWGLIVSPDRTNSHECGACLARGTV